MMADNDPEVLDVPTERKAVELEAVREVSKMISDFRQEVMDKYRQDMEAELQKMEAEGFDPARGRGRGPRWADGG